MSKAFAICRHIMVLQIDIYCGTRETGSWSDYNNVKI